MVRCDDCSFKAKNNAGLSAHRRARHPEPERGPVEGAVARDLRQVADLGGLRASTLKLAAKIDETTSSRDLPGLVAELRAAYTQLGISVSGKGEADAVDELTARRAARIAGSEDSARAGKGK